MLREFDVAYFMASVDDAATNARFAEANAADFPILSDPDRTVARAYGVLGEAGYAARWTFYIDRNGRIAHIDKSVSAISAGTDIAARLEKLGAPRVAD